MSGRDHHRSRGHPVAYRLGEEPAILRIFVDSGSRGEPLKPAGLVVTEATRYLRHVDDDTLLAMYEEARAEEHQSCDDIVNELAWRGIEVQPCGHAAGIN